jgi:mannose/fructose/N-acetylgalactosamine-specific phosphotransferase system component IIC
MPFDILLVSLVAAVLAIDVRTIGGTMISRPLVVGPLVGLLLGNIGIGLIVAILVELLWIGMLPVGAYLPVETLPVTTVAAGLTILLKDTISLPQYSLIIFALMAAIPLGYVGRWLEIHIRNLNSVLSAYLVRQAGKGDFSRISLIQGLNVFITFLKSFLLCFLPLYFGRGILENIVHSLPYQVKEGIVYSIWLIPALGFAVVLEIFLVTRYVKYFFASYFAAIALFHAAKILK